MATKNKKRSAPSRPPPTKNIRRGGAQKETPTPGLDNNVEQVTRDAKARTVKQGKGSSRKPRGSSSRGAKKNPRPSFYLSPARQEEIAAVTLLGIAILTALGAFNLTGGNILDGWTKTLSILFGVGRVLAPVFFGGLGVWLLLDSLDLRPDIGWERPFGFVIIFLILLTVFHIPFSGAQSLDAAEHGEGGGLIGYAISDFMVNAIGTLGTLLILFIFFCIALILLFNIPLMRIIALAGEAWHGLEGVFFNSARAWKSERPRADVNPRPIEYDRGVEPRVVGTPELTVPPDVATERKPILPEAEPRPTLPRRAEPELPRPPLAARIVGSALQPAVSRAPTHRPWQLPSMQDLLEESVEQEISAHEIRTKVRQIEETLQHFGVPAKVIEVNQGPTITQFGVEPGFLEQKGSDGSARRTKVKVSRISGLQHDLELALAAAPIRVEAPVPGKSIVGIEVPNSQISMVSLRGVMESEEFKKLAAKSRLAIALGRDVSGQAIVANLASMPHLLIAGATGSGKSVCVNALIACLLITNSPDDLNFIMVDPKRVELSTFNSIPHLYKNRPVVVDMSEAVAALQVAVQEMDERYKRFSAVGARNLEAYNQLTEQQRRGPKLPYLILVVDELADLMMVSPDEVEKAITRLAQMARATGIHLVLATQRPSVDVVTGLIKANFPSRISFAVTSQIDSRVVLDTPGAEKLLGRGDMLYMASDSSKLLRLQGCFVSDRELDKLVKHWKSFIDQAPDVGAQQPGQSNTPLARVSPSSVMNGSTNVGSVMPPAEQGDWVQPALWSEAGGKPKPKSEEDELLEQAIQVIKMNDRASVSLLQRKLRIGYSRAAKLIDLLEERGYVGPDEGPAKGREILTKGDLPAAGAPPTSRTPANGTKASGKTSRASRSQKSSPQPPPSKSRDFVNEDNIDTAFDDWTEEDWADLDKD